MFQTQHWATQLQTSFSSHSSNIAVRQLVLESRMREIRLSGLSGGLPLQDVLFMNAGRDLP